MHAGLSARNDHELWRRGLGFSGQFSGGSLANLLGDVLRVPSRGRVAPSALYRAALEADEEGLATQMDALPLLTQERLIDRIKVRHGQAFGW